MYFHPFIAGPAFQQMRSHRTLARSSDGKQEADAGKGFQIVIYDGFEITLRTAALAEDTQKTEGERRLHRKRFKVSKSDPRPSSYCEFGNFRIAAGNRKRFNRVSPDGPWPRWLVDLLKYG